MQFHKECMKLIKRANIATSHINIIINDNKITNDAINLAYKDFSKKVLWLTQDHSGLDRFDMKSKKHGLSDNNIYAILQDNNGDLWVSHNKGLSRFDIEDIQVLQL